MELSIPKADLCTRLGLVNAACCISPDVEGYLRDKLKIVANEVVQHSAALSLGVTGMGGKNEQSYDNLKIQTPQLLVRLRGMAWVSSCLLL
ncbi:hypothetical protein DFH11DRAFT_1633409 [Phellopilus nigrolimitatus]|nr:hypothetical protein DFH11DRAFT_1633409 [Phellopilus nigrolimitatus]